jgi:hypothetical protein
MGIFEKSVIGKLTLVPKIKKLKMTRQMSIFYSFSKTTNANVISNINFIMPFKMQI